MIAISAGVFENVDRFFTDWSKANNPFFNGPHADLFSLLPFAALMVFLYLVAREKLLAPKRA